MASDAFARAYLATLYLLGERGEELARASGSLGPSSLLRALTSDERGKRAVALANELAQIALGLEEGGIA